LTNAKLKAKAILLDLDGTVVDSRKAYLEASRTAFAAMGQRTVDIRIVIEIPKRLEQDLPIDDLVTEVDARKFLQLYLKAYYQATASRTEPFPNTADTLKELSEKAKLALITRRNVSKKEVISELEKFDLAKYFQEVVTSQDTHKPKPSPEALIKCSKQLNVEIGDSLVVGDSVVDVEAGKNAGAKTVAVLSGIFSREELEREKPDLILENIRKLPEFLG
jgi:HAD superfamily hydrolase (TIGR01549 family)